jgi:hypothetical protein
MKCTNCGRTIYRMDGGGWAHIIAGRVYCPGGEPFGVMATPEPDVSEAADRV